MELTLDYYNNEYNYLMVRDDSRPRGDIILSCVIISRDEQIRSTQIVMTLVGSESRLDAGRFAKFQPTLKSLPISLLCNNDLYFCRTFSNIVEWMAENCQGGWAFHIGRPSFEKLTLTMFFSDETDAMLYRLSLCGEVI